MSRLVPEERQRPGCDRFLHSHYIRLHGIVPPDLLVDDRFDFIDIARR